MELLGPITTRLPITAWVTTQLGPMRQSSPITTPRPITTLLPMWQLAPICAPAPISPAGPISVPWPTVAVGCTGWNARTPGASFCGG